MVIKTTPEFKGLFFSYPDCCFSQWLTHQKVTAEKDLVILDMVPDFQKFIISLGKINPALMKQLNINISSMWANISLNGMHRLGQKGFRGGEKDHVLERAGK